MMGSEFSYTMSDGTVVDIEVDCDPEDSLVYTPDDESTPLSWDRINGMSRNLLLYGTVDRPDFIVPIGS